MQEDETRAAIEDYRHAMGSALVSPDYLTTQVELEVEPAQETPGLPRSGVLYTSIVVDQAHA